MKCRAFRNLLGNLCINTCFFIVSILPHWGVSPEPHSLFPVGPSAPYASSLAISPNTGNLQTQSWTPCLGTTLCPRCSRWDAPQQVHHKGLQSKDRQTCFKLFIIYKDSMRVCERRSLLGWPSDNTFTSTVATVASPDSWSIAMTWNIVWLSIIMFLYKRNNMINPTSQPDFIWY